MTLTRDSIAQSLYEQLTITHTDARRYVEIVLKNVKETLEGGEDVLISGFGKFSVSSKNERNGRNPATGESLILGARRVVTFRCSPVLRRKLDRVNYDR
ncbi:MAG: integration host factor subunit alpha [Desulfobacteraceae bacterium]|nr:MAG: integration host factor subunit alpha [Desulfobacteraceae bacterium]